jgi:NAD(P)-dependent dehydrogenase (short-subunit alcohol dehydrogenase family)
MRLQGKRAVVTGAASGIGKATATRFATEGALVVVADIDRDAGMIATDSIRSSGSQAEFVEVDVTDEAAVEQLVARANQFLGGIDVWMNNAGTSLTEDLLDIETADWEADLRLNLTSHFLCTRSALPAMIESGGGSIINTSSVNGLWAIGEFGYSAAKAALISLTKNLAVTYGPQGIRANVICPGTIDTERGGAYWDQKVGGKEKLTKWYPVGRLGKPADIAALAVYLASDESSFVSGAEIVIDGGLTAGTSLFGKV